MPMNATGAGSMQHAAWPAAQTVDATTELARIRAISRRETVELIEGLVSKVGVLSDETEPMISHGLKTLARLDGHVALKNNPTREALKETKDFLRREKLKLHLVQKALYLDEVRLREIRGGHVRELDRKCKALEADLTTTISDLGKIRSRVADLVSVIPHIRGAAAMDRASIAPPPVTSAGSTAAMTSPPMAPPPVTSLVSATVTTRSPIAAPRMTLLGSAATLTRAPIVPPRMASRGAAAGIAQAPIVPPRTLSLGSAAGRTDGFRARAGNAGAGFVTAAGGVTVTGAGYPAWANLPAEPLPIDQSWGCAIA